ncbi:effector-associated domain EAD1-containing protein [Streptomyces scabiei]|uniref:effector-associated domain EAD1-containing protein n=1 Tax=Streptomyces scabiei TaxID=1930 RepID=UPI00131EAFA0|nr:effector-associated domain EAD1-containing protein [Streptomyces scabiei]
MAGFTDGELQALAERYHESRKARLLLGRAGYPKERVPEFTDASSFWYEINQEIESGVMTDGRDRILAEDEARYPARPIGSYPGSGQNPPPNPQPPPGSGLSLTSNQVAIAGAVIGGLAVVIAAVVTGLFGLIDAGGTVTDAKSGSSATPREDGTSDSPGIVNEERDVKLHASEPGYQSVEMDYWRQELDNAASAPNGDLWMRPGHLDAVDSAALAKIERSPDATPARCARVTSWATRIDFSTLRVGDQLCGRSTEGRYAMLRVITLPAPSGGSGFFVFHGIVWKR